MSLKNHCFSCSILFIVNQMFKIVKHVIIIFPIFHNNHHHDSRGEAILKGYWPCTSLRGRNNSAIQAGEAFSDKKSPSLRKLLLVIVLGLCLLIVLIINNVSKRIEPQNHYPLYLLTLFPTLVLLFYTLDRDIGQFVLKLCTDCHIWFPVALGISARVAPMTQHQTYT